MKKRDLTDQVLKRLHQLGADLAGVVSFECLNACPAGRKEGDDV